MKILSLELQGYKRLKLNAINYIKLTPENKIVLILGSNGSGKSSLMKELTPLPAISTEYEKDGYKVIQISHNNDEYLLKNIFSSSGNKYNFIKNNEELNPGNTITVFRELVKSEFNITQDAHDLMIGQRTFHDMSGNERRLWFTKISNIDYNFALNYYSKLKETLRDIAGIIKHNKVKLIQEMDKVINVEEELKIKKGVEHLKILLTNILNTKTIINKDKNSMLDSLKKYNEEIERLSLNIINKKTVFNTLNIETNINIEDKILDYKSEIKSLNMQIVELYKKIEKEQDMLISLEKTKKKDIIDIDSDINNFSNEITSLYSMKKININFTDSKQSFQALNTIIDNLVSIFIEMVPNEDKKYSRDNYSILVNKLEQNKIQTTILNNKQDLLIIKRKELEHFKEHNKIECPKCSHMWIKGYNENDYINIIKQITLNETNINELKIIHNKIEKELLEAKEYIELYKSYVSISRNWDVLNNLWEYLINSSIIFKDPRKIPNILEQVRQDLIIDIKIKELVDKINNLDKLKEMFSNSKDLDFNNIKNVIKEHEQQLDNYNNQIKMYNDKLSKLYIYKQLVIDIESSEYNIKKLMNKKENDTNALLDIIKQNYLNKSIELIQLEITKYEIQLSKIDVQKAIITDLEKQLIELEDKQEVLKIAVKELSPNEGLIAESLTGFINQFVFQINNFIKKVWSYPLELIPVVPDDSDEFDLDYKFAVRINNEGRIPDISKASLAMKEIINLSFKLVSMQYLGLQNFPVYLDELGSSFDKAHRGSVINLIQNLMLSSNFSQVFIISHYEEIYGSLRNTDINVLCSANIPTMKNDTFNTHLLIK